MDYSIIQRPLRLAFGAFVVAAIGAALGFTADYVQVHWLALFAFGVVVLAVTFGVVAVGWGWYRIFFSRR